MTHLRELPGVLLGLGRIPAVGLSVPGDIEREHRVLLQLVLVLLRVFPGNAV